MKLNFFRRSAREPALRFDTAELNVLGRDICGFMGSLATTHLTTAGWGYCGMCYPVIAVTGGGCLLFETHHNVRFISDPVDHLYFIGGSLSANGVGVAKYNTHENLWEGIQRPMWYRFFRIVETESVPRVIGGRTTVRLNPWENHLQSMSDTDWTNENTFGQRPHVLEPLSTQTRAVAIRMAQVPTQVADPGPVLKLSTTRW